MDDLKTLAFTSIVTTIAEMEQSRLIKAAFSPFASRQDLSTNTKIIVQPLTYCIDTRKSVISMSSDSNIFWPMDPMRTFDNNFFVIFPESFLIAGTFSHPYSKLSWRLSPWLGVLLERTVIMILSQGCLFPGQLGPKVQCLCHWTMVPLKTSVLQFHQDQNQLGN